MNDTTVPNADALSPLEFADEIETDTTQVLSNVGKLVQDIIWQRKKPRMSIPADYCDDDLVIGGAINQAEKDLKEAAILIRTLTTKLETEQNRGYQKGYQAGRRVAPYSAEEFRKVETHLSHQTQRITELEYELSQWQSAFPNFTIPETGE